MDILTILNRTSEMFRADLKKYNSEIDDIVARKRFLVIGGGGSIGQAVCKELFQRRASGLHVVDLSENYLVELVRDIRSSCGYRVNDFDTYSLDCGSEYFGEFIKKGEYDYVLNLSAMKHVRSENSQFSMLRMLETNLFNVLSSYKASIDSGVEKYFCVSTDKAANPVNFMGASKRAMELCLFKSDPAIDISGARFANVAFSNGSLLEGFINRINKTQPLSIPSDISRYFITANESGIICLFSAILASTNEIYFPFNDKEIRLTQFTEIAQNYLRIIGKEAVFVGSEDEAKSLIHSLDLEKYWPVNLFETDTVGEKPFEEFYTKGEQISYSAYSDLASLKCVSDKTEQDVNQLVERLKEVKIQDMCAGEKFIEILEEFIPNFNHASGTKYLNGRM